MTFINIDFVVFWKLFCKKLVYFLVHASFLQYEPLTTSMFTCYLTVGERLSDLFLFSRAFPDLCCDCISWFYFSLFRTKYCNRARMGSPISSFLLFFLSWFSSNESKKSYGRCKLFSTLLSHFHLLDGYLGISSVINAHSNHLKLGTLCFQAQVTNY